MVSIYVRVLRTLLFLSLVLCAIPLLAQQTGSISGKVTASDGAALPGVTVEATSDVLPKPRVTVTGANGEYRLPALPPGNYTLKFALSGMQTVTRTADVQLSQDTSVDAHDRHAGDSGGLGDRRGVPGRQGLGGHHQRVVQAGNQVAADRSGLPRPAEVHPVRAVHRGHGARAERRRQRTGQRLSVRRRQRDACRSSARSPPSPPTTTSPRSRSSTAARRAVDFDRSGGFSIDSVSKSGTSAYHGEVELPVPDRGHGRGLEQRHPVAVRAGPQLVDREPRRPDPQGPRCTSTGRTTARSRLETTGPTSTAPCRPTTARATKVSASSPSRRLRPSCSTSATATRNASTQSDLFAPTPRRRRAPATRPTEDRHRRRVVGHQLQELRDDQVHALRQRHAGAAGQHLLRGALVRDRHAISTSPTWTRRAC